MTRDRLVQKFVLCPRLLESDSVGEIMDYDPLIYSQLANYYDDLVSSEIYSAQLLSYNIEL